MIDFVIYHISKIARQLSRLLMLLFIIYINALPIIKHFNDRFEYNYMQVEVLGEEDLAGKEIFVEKPAKEEPVYLAKLVMLIPFFSHFFSDFKPDILLPPPKYS
jgi:hypothetical protein